MKFQWIFWIVFGYLLGGILFSWHLPKLLTKKDTRKLSSDHNPGAANAFVHTGWKIGLLCLLCDLLKGFLPVYGAAQRLDCRALPFALVMLAPVLGHATAPYYKFSGGKSIAVSFGVLTALIKITPVIWILVFFYILFSVVVKIRPTRIRSIVTFSIFGVLSAVFSAYTCQYAIGLGCIAIAGIVIYKHWMAKPQPTQASAVQPVLPFNGSEENEQTKSHQ